MRRARAPCVERSLCLCRWAARRGLAAVEAACARWTTQGSPRPVKATVCGPACAVYPARGSSSVDADALRPVIEEAWIKYFSSLPLQRCPVSAMLAGTCNLEGFLLLPYSDSDGSRHYARWALHGPSGHSGVNDWCVGAAGVVCMRARSRSRVYAESRRRHPLTAMACAGACDLTNAAVSACRSSGIASWGSPFVSFSTLFCHVVVVLRGPQRCVVYF
jgi:hypothetical protein